MKKIIAALIAAFVSVTAAYGQSQGTVTNHAFAVGKGPNNIGYTSLLCGSAQLAVGQAAADPICRTITGDAALSAAGALTLGTVNANVGTFGSATQCNAFTVNAKGLITAASQLACTSVNNVAFPSGAAVDRVPVAAALNTLTYTALPNCTSGVLQYSTSTHLFNCGAAGSGTVTSVGITSTDGTLAVSGSPVTTNGNINVQLSAARKTNPTIQRFTSGSGTYTVSGNVLWIEIELVGGGGGGGAQSTNNGTAGGDTCFAASGAACTAPILRGTGGSGGPTSSIGASGGGASGGNVYNIGGGNGTAFFLLGASQAIGGGGGNSCRGGAGQSSTTTGGAGVSGTGGGGSGAGSTTTSVSGAGGGAGGCVKHIINAPAATYTYVVGTGGAGGVAGVNAGGAGGSGEIDIIEHYN